MLCLHIHGAYTYIQTNTWQYCSDSGGMCDSLQINFNNPGTGCKTNADCTDLGKHKAPKKLCCASFDKITTLMCDGVPAATLKASTDAARIAGSCVDTPDCYDYKLQVVSSAASISTSVLVTSVFVCLNALLHAMY